jgi:hypothetical protein
MVWVAAKRDGRDLAVVRGVAGRAHRLGDRHRAARGPYPVGSTARLYVELSLATRIPFEALVLEDDATIATYLELLDERAAEG